MAEDRIIEFQKIVEENPKNVENWLLLIEAHISAGIDMRDIGNVFLRAGRANPSHDRLYSCAIEALEGFDMDDIIMEIMKIRKKEMDKPQGLL